MSQDMQVLRKALQVSMSQEEYWNRRWQWCVEHNKIMYVTLEEYREIASMPLNLSHSWKVYRNRFKTSISIISRKAAAQRRQFDDSKGRSS